MPSLQKCSHAALGSGPLHTLSAESRSSSNLLPCTVLKVTFMGAILKHLPPLGSPLLIFKMHDAKLSSTSYCQTACGLCSSSQCGEDRGACRRGARRHAFNMHQADSSWKKNLHSIEQHTKLPTLSSFFALLICVGRKSFALLHANGSAEWGSEHMMGPTFDPQLTLTSSMPR